MHVSSLWFEQKKKKKQIIFNAKNDLQIRLFDLVRIPMNITRWHTVCQHVPK